HGVAVDADRALVGGNEAAEDVKKGALAAAARPDDGDELAFARDEPLDLDDLQRHPVLGVGLADAGGLERYFSGVTGHPCPERSNFTPASWSFFSKKRRPPSLERSTGGGG